VPCRTTGRQVPGAHDDALDAVAPAEPSSDGSVAAADRTEVATCDGVSIGDRQPDTTDSTDRASAAVGARNSVVAGQAASRYSLMRPSHRLDLMTRGGS
jgi:hypothetical protein